MRTALAALAFLVAGACSDLTDVEERDVIELSDVQNATGAAALRAGALGSFNTMFGQNFSQILLSGLLSDELMGAAPGSGGLDQRSIADPSSDLVYAPLHTARIRISSAIPVVQQRSNTPRWVSELFALRGYTEIFFGENYCSGIPLGTIVDGLPVYGQPLTTAKMFEQAVQDLDSALVYAAADTNPGGTPTAAGDSVRTLARVGRGRALLNLGQFGPAAAAVASVPTSSVYRIIVSSNSIFNFTSFRSASVSDTEGANGLNFRAANDPRVPTQVVTGGTGFLVGSTTVRAFSFTTYSAGNSPIKLATGVEARLIEAEAALRAGNMTAWLTTLNTLRTSCTSAATCPTPAPAGTGGVAGLPLLTDPGTPDARVDLMFRERAFWMFGTGHRHGDLRRLIRPISDGGYGRNAGTVFPTGPYYTGSGATYGDDVTLTPTGTQQLNPAFTTCLSRTP